MKEETSTEATIQDLIDTVEIRKPVLDSKERYQKYRKEEHSIDKGKIKNWNSRLVLGRKTITTTVYASLIIASSMAYFRSDFSIVGSIGKYIELKLAAIEIENKIKEVNSPKLDATEIENNTKKADLPK